MTFLRTPDECFTNLPDFDFTPNYITIRNRRLHYLDEGPADGKTVLLMHGNPTWCYLYRKMIPRLTSKGMRVIAPDLIGFGRSDKPISNNEHTYQRHIQIMAEFVRLLDIQQATLFVQDWGGLIGLRVVVEEAARFEKIIAAKPACQPPDA